jgi:hypothetical protein
MEDLYVEDPLASPRPERGVLLIGDGARSVEATDYGEFVEAPTSCDRYASGGHPGVRVDFWCRPASFRIVRHAKEQAIWNATDSEQRSRTYGLRQTV